MTKPAYKFFYVNPEKCIGCNLCEYACSLKKAGCFNPLQSRIRVVRMHPFINLALTCRLCDNPPCITTCPRKVLTQNERTRIINVDSDKCDGCGQCIEACPYGAIRYDEEVRSVVICDLCEGEPECKKICPAEAIEFAASSADVDLAWVAAYNKWVEEARKFIRLAERGELDVFDKSMATIEQIDEKLRLLFKKYISTKHSEYTNPL
ncbi:MAG: 4Fe-4S dicluster domain-containing protein [Candidatus Bathyarchaeota archaeon]